MMLNKRRPVKIVVPGVQIPALTSLKVDVTDILVRRRIVMTARVNVIHTNHTDVIRSIEKDLEVHIPVVTNIAIGVDHDLFRATPQVFQIDLPPILLRNILGVELPPLIVPIVMT